MARKTETKPRRKITPEVLEKVRALAEEGGPALVARRLHYDPNYARQLIRRANGEIPSPHPAESAAARVSSTAQTIAVRRYLDQVRTDATSERKRLAPGYAMLGQLPGFPSVTSDPKTIERAVVEYERRASNAPNVLAELKWRQRVLDLRGILEHSSSNGSSVDPEADFVRYALAWSERNGISYAAFREIGVPARVLKAAGIAIK